MSRVQVRSLLGGCLDRLGQDLPLFDPLAAGPDIDGFRLKAFSELSLLCHLARLSLPTETADWRKRCLEAIASVCARGEYQAAILANPHSLPFFALAHLALKELLTVPPDHEVLLRVVDEGYATAIEQGPSDLAGLRYALMQAGIDVELPHPSALYSLTLLSKHPSPLLLTDSDVYTVTHTLFYFTQFGEVALDSAFGEETSFVQGFIDTLLGLYVREGNGDLTAELLTVAEIIMSPASRTMNAAWEALIGLQAPDGSVRGPSTEQDDGHPSGQDRRWASFQQNYHTTIMTSAAALLSLAHAPEGGRDRSKVIGSAQWFSSIPSGTEDMGQRAREWALSMSQQRRDAGLSLNHLLQVLVTTWICERALAPESSLSGCRLALRALRERLDLPRARSSAALFQCDPSLVLLAHGISRRAGTDIAPLDSFATSLASTLAESEAELETHQVRYLLFTLGMMEEPLEAVLLEALPSTAQLLCSDESLIRSFAAQVAAFTGYGTRRLPQRSKISAIAATVVPIWAADYLRFDNLDLGSMLLRTMVYAGADAFSIQVCYSSIVRQQQRDGRFGFLAPWITHLQSDAPGLDPDLDVYLPVTLGCSWALAEATVPGFHLLCSV